MTEDTATAGLASPSLEYWVMLVAEILRRIARGEAADPKIYLDQCLEWLASIRNHYAKEKQL